MITLHTGKLGAGKSYWATREVWKNIVKGRDCYVNWKIDFSSYWEYRTKGWRGLLWALWIKFTFANEKFGKVYYWDTLDQLYKIRNGEVFFDEAHMSVYARDFKSLPPEFRTKLTQSRKYGLNLHFITQHQGQIDVFVRRLANAITVHKKYFKIFGWKEYDGEAIEILSNPEMMAIQSPKTQGFGFHLFSKQLAKSYDTFALFDPFEKYEGKPMWSVKQYYDNLDREPVKGAKVVPNPLLQAHEPVKGGEQIVSS